MSRFKSFCALMGCALAFILVVGGGLFGLICLINLSSDYFARDVSAEAQEIAAKPAWYMMVSNFENPKPSIVCTVTVSLFATQPRDGSEPDYATTMGWKKTEWETGDDWTAVIKPIAKSGTEVKLLPRFTDDKSFAASMRDMSPTGKYRRVKMEYTVSHALEAKGPSPLDRLSPMLLGEK